MEERKASSASKNISIAEVSFDPVPVGPAPHPARSLDPRIVAEHFATLPASPPSAETRWRDKEHQAPFPGV